MDSASPTPGERWESTRRQFMKVLTFILGTVMAAVLAVPFVSSLFGPALRRKNVHWTRVGKLPVLGSGHPTKISFTDMVEDAYLRENVTRDVWIVKLPSGGLTAFSPICPHLGCHYNWDAASGHFVCPCHGSVFALDGAVLGGPTPRPLDTLPVKIENGELYIGWERFEPGISRKIRV
ncbi:MAG: ubiquinol-cytochrome c reductase iron-sulfur subunit [Proteobacteria bacterium]|nr:ubiquinol-cytochrome c reductase iron-sulfur subunit [Pseudomonadota bacterium]